jgi:hypothetical protein
VEGDEPDAEEIGRIAKIKHIQNKQRKNNIGKNQNQKNRENKQKQNTTGNKARTWK